VSDRRRILANGRVAATGLEGQVASEKFTDGVLCRIKVPQADLRAAPAGKRDRQLLFGDAFLVLEIHAGWGFGQAQKDGYVGYVSEGDLAEYLPPTHRVVARATHVYPTDDFKSEALCGLSFGALVTVTDAGERFAALATGGFVPNAHIAPVTERFNDPVDVAEKFIGVPYLWGGNSIGGIDCSGLVQMSLLACGMDCPGDADMQETELGQAIGDNVQLRRGDLLFWKGHVAMMVDADTIIHANAHHMAVVREPMEAAVRRIETQGFGPVTRRKRLPG